MKIKKTDIQSIYNNLDELRGFISGFLDFADGDQAEYIHNIIDSTDKSLEVLESIFKEV